MSPLQIKIFYKTKELKGNPTKLHILGGWTNSSFQTNNLFVKAFKT